MNRQRILVVTATRETADWLTDMLALTGDQVDAVTDGAAAFQLVWDAEYDVIVSEVGVPGIDGRDLHMAFQNTWPELTRRMVFLCGAPTASIEEFAGRAGVPLVRGQVSLMDLREAVRCAATAPRSRALV
jgi:DNA-binding response OmpR family regulator